MRILIKALIVVFVYSVSLPGFAQADTLAEIMEAGNRRDIDDNHIILGLASDDIELVNKTLMVVGNIGGSKAGAFIAEKLQDPRAEVRGVAAFAAGIAGDKSMFEVLKVAVGKEKAPDVAARMYHAMGYMASETMRPYFALELLGTSDRTILRGILDGYMQSIVYAKAKASELPYTNFNAILDIAAGDDDAAAAAAYFLGRVLELSTVLQPEAVVKSINTSKSKTARMHLVRVLGQMDGDNSVAILPYLSDPAGAIRLEAIKGMGKARDPLHIIALQSASVSEFAVLRKAAIDVFTASDDIAFVYQGKILMDKGLSDPSIWVQGASLRGVARISKDGAEHIAATWFDVSGSYRKGYAVEMLANSEPFKQDIEFLAEDGFNPYLQAKARAVLEMPEIVHDTKPRPVVTYEEAIQAGLSTLRFETTKGVIRVQLSDKAPFTSHNFVTLAREKVFDGMLFHRVIGNFVAQAGERITPLHEDWGSIREEWSELRNEIGTVGLATSGKDTGTRQFFFNTANNRHLDGRYTVFGKVIEGLNVMMRLEEGDRIITALVE